ncbi:hypothetical protein J6590_037060 [Homalodisca vitripennis]|nr:hypothetical protein J6590_037060 [Homalodisca vitripennis]
MPKDIVDKDTKEQYKVRREILKKLQEDNFKIKAGIDSARLLAASASWRMLGFASDCGYGVARYEAFASHNVKYVLVGFRAVLKLRCLAPSCASIGYLCCLPRTVQETILHCKPTNLHNETLLAEELTLRQMARGIRSEQPRTVNTGLKDAMETMEEKMVA